MKLMVTVDWIESDDFITTSKLRCQIMEAKKANEEEEKPIGNLICSMRSLMKQVATRDGKEVDYKDLIHLGNLFIKK